MYRELLVRFCTYCNFVLLLLSTYSLPDSGEDSEDDCSRRTRRKTRSVHRIALRMQLVHISDKLGFSRNLPDFCVDVTTLFTRKAKRFVP